MSRSFRRTGARLACTAALLASLTLAACGDSRSPFGVSSDEPTSSTAAASTPAPAGPDVTPLPSSPGEAPAPAGGTKPSGSKRGPEPTDLAGRIAADKTAMINVRTMVSVIEGCHSGHTSYRDCNTHQELGSPELLGLEIGKKTGQVQISATTNGFRLTARSLSGAKFTVARGPKGDRFKCIAGPHPGACPEDRTWTW
jgi:hypothetical protein